MAAGIQAFDVLAHDHVVDPGTGIAERRRRPRVQPHGPEARIEIEAEAEPEDGVRARLAPIGVAGVGQAGSPSSMASASRHALYTSSDIASPLRRQAPAPTSNGSSLKANPPAVSCSSASKTRTVSATTSGPILRPGGQRGRTSRGDEGAVLLDVLRDAVAGSDPSRLRAGAGSGHSRSTTHHAGPRSALRLGQLLADLHVRARSELATICATSVVVTSGPPAEPWRSGRRCPGRRPRRAPGRRCPARACTRGERATELEVGRLAAHRFSTIADRADVLVHAEAVTAEVRIVRKSSPSAWLYAKSIASAAAFVEP